MTEPTRCPNPACPGSHPVMLKSGKSHYGHCLACETSGPTAKDIATATALWDALPKELVWTKELPTVQGAYWLLRVGRYLSNGIPIMIRVERDTDDTLYYFVGAQTYHPQYKDDHWFAGPILAPPKPKEIA